MKKQNYYLVTGALLCSAFSGLAIPIASTFADSPDRHWMVNTGFDDLNLFTCVLNSYKNANNVDDDWLVDNLGPDDPLPAEGLAHITSLTCINKGVSSATGLYNLPNLEWLDLSDNEGLQEIDLSSNTALKWLDLSGDSIATTLDLSHNQNLEQLNVQGTPLSFLDLSNNHQLAYIDIEDTNINSLDISAFSWKLRTLYANNNLTVFTEGARSNLCEGENPIVCDYGALMLVSRAVGVPQYTIDDTDNYTFDNETGYLTVTNPEGTGGYVVARNTHASGGEQIRFHLFDVDSDEPADSDSSQSTTDSNPAAPNTGSFTSDNKGLIIGISAVSISTLSIIGYLFRYVINRHRSKVHLGKH